MDLPVRVLAGASPEPVISVDGAWDAPGLNLSHWPGHTTPAALRHDLSTGSALAFARLAPAERADLAGGATAIANNHYDTDGICSLFAVRHPEAALARSARLLEAAFAGDFFSIPSEEALVVDVCVAKLPEAGSPLAAELAGLDGVPRWQRMTEHWMEHLPALLDGDRAPYRELWEPVLEATRAERAALAAARRDEVPELDLTVWTVASPAPPLGRHALLGSTPRDRVLVLGESEGGTTARFLLSTRSWFDLVTIRALPRPDLEALAATLNELESAAPDGEAAWRAQSITGASPELWFGTAELGSFEEYSGALRPSRLSAADIRAAVERGLR